MNISFRRLALALLAPVVAVSFTACNPQPDPFHTTIISAETGVAGGVTVETTEVVATVQEIDALRRKVTLLAEDGKRGSVKFGPEAVNFGQLRVGDRLKVRLVEEVAVFVGAAAAAAAEGASRTIGLAAPGEKPGGFVMDAADVTAKVIAIDLKKHTATLEFSDGRKKTVKVRPDIDLTQHSIGESVLIRTTDTVVLSVSRP